MKSALEIHLTLCLSAALAHKPDVSSDNELLNTVKIKYDHCVITCDSFRLLFVSDFIIGALMEVLALFLMISHLELINHEHTKCVFHNAVSNKSDSCGQQPYELHSKHECYAKNTMQCRNQN